MIEPIIRNIENGEKHDFCVGNRVKYRIPERGGYSLGFGKVLKVNRKTLEIMDEKHCSGKLLIDKRLIFSEVIFNKECSNKR